MKISKETMLRAVNVWLDSRFLTNAPKAIDVKINRKGDTFTIIFKKEKK